MDEELQNALDEFESLYGDDANEQEKMIIPEERTASEGMNISGEMGITEEMNTSDRMDIPEEMNISERMDIPKEMNTSDRMDMTEEMNIPEKMNISERVNVSEENTFYRETPPYRQRQIRRHKKKRRLYRQNVIRIVSVCAAVALVFGSGFFLLKKMNKKSKTPEVTKAVSAPATTQATTESEESKSLVERATIMTPQKTDQTISIPAADLSVFNVTQTDAGETDTTYDPWSLVTVSLESVDGSLNQTSPGVPEETSMLTSTYMVLVDADTGEIVAERDSEKVVPPASMTKILTVLTARDYITEDKLEDTFTITSDIINEAQSSGLSCVGFLPGDEVTVRDMLYGTIVCSGADAAMGLAIYCAGSEEAFVEQMNKNVEKLGLSDTAHFTNPVGKYDENLNCTMTDMAVILSVAMQDPLLKDVLSTRIYHTEIKYPDLDMPDGMEISNWFLRRIEDKEMNGQVTGAKTGFVNQSGFCAASYYEADTGKHYVCVTGNANSAWRAIYDHVSVYRSFTQ